ncbi:MAG: glycosyltransferase family 2 protein [Propionibacteriaceae bacterium]|nr:glycosyltransferase family 2 protein [Propionibacteriaceae bacterium]
MGIGEKALAGLRQRLWWAKLYQGRADRRLQRLVNAQLVMASPLPRARRQPGSVWAVTMVRNEQDIIGLTIAHLFGQGVDHVVVADNNSTDATPQILRDLAAEYPRLHLARDAEPAYYQSQKMTRLAQLAARAGADWVIPFDADEWWFAPGASLKEWLAREAANAPGVAMVKAALHNMVPTGDALGGPEAEFLMDSSASLPGKVAVRAHPYAVIAMGNHGAARVGTIREGLRIAHAAYRSAEQIERKVRLGAQAVELAGGDQTVATHWRAGASLGDAEHRQIWDNLRRGGSDARLNYFVRGPMVRVRPGAWATWDPDGVVPQVAPHQNVPAEDPAG